MLTNKIYMYFEPFYIYVWHAYYKINIKFLYYKNNHYLI